MNHPSNVKLHQRKVVNIRSTSRELRKIANRVRELSHKVGTKDHTMELNKEGRSLQIEADSLILKLKDWDSFLKSAINQGMYRGFFLILIILFKDTQIIRIHLQDFEERIITKFTRRVLERFENTNPRTIS